MAEVAFKLKNGAVVYVDVPQADHGGLVANPGLPAQAKQTFEDAVSTVQPVAEALLAQFRTLSVHPDEVSLEFGITLKVDAGVLIARTGAEANFKIAVKWKGHGS
jgi:hypothetical protein